MPTTRLWSSASSWPSTRFPAWSRTDPEARAAILRRGIELLDANRERLVDTLVHEQGKPTFEASGELDHLIHGLRYYADLPVVVFNLFEEGNIERVIEGEPLGTTIRS